MTNVRTLHFPGDPTISYALRHRTEQTIRAPRRAECDSLRKMWPNSNSHIRFCVNHIVRFLRAWSSTNQCASLCSSAPHSVHLNSTACVESDFFRLHRQLELAKCERNFLKLCSNGTLWAYNLICLQLYLATCRAPDPADTGKRFPGED